MTHLTRLILLFGVLLLLTGHGRAQEDAPSGEPIYVGYVGALTGPVATLTALGALQAEIDINASGGINGRPLKLIVEDDMGEQTLANKAALKLAGDDRIVAVVGHCVSSCSLAARDIYREAGLAMVTPGSTNVALTQGYPNVFRNIFTDRIQAKALVEIVGSLLGHSSVALLHDNDDYGADLADFFAEEAAGRHGLKIVERREFDRHNADFTAALQAVAKKNPEAIVLVGRYKEAALIVHQARLQGIGVPIVASDGVYNDKFIQMAGPAAEGVFVIAPFIFEEEDERAMEFFRAVKSRTGVEPDAWAALGYDTTMLVAKAIRMAGPHREAITEYLAAVDSEERAFDGITGLTYFDENGDCVKIYPAEGGEDDAPIHLAVVRKGEFHRYTASPPLPGSQAIRKPTDIPEHPKN